MSEPTTTAPVTSKAAIASLVLGILTLPTCGITALPGIVFGIVAWVRISRSPESLKGRYLALAGVVLPVLSLLLALAPAARKSKVKADGILCIARTKSTVLALHQYAQDHDGTLPSAGTWCDDVANASASTNAILLRCPAGGLKDQAHYGLNSRLAGRPLASVKEPFNTVLIFEIEGGWNISGGPESLLRNPRHGRGLTVGFVDGHAEILFEPRLRQLRWNP